MQAFLNGEYMALADAKVNVMTHALNYGTGVFEGIRAYWDDEEEQLLLFRVREHFERMHQSARILRIGIDYSVDELVEICVNVLRAGNFREDVYVRPLAFKSALQVGLNMVAMGPDGLQPIENGFTLFALPFGNYLDIEKPIRCTISAWRRVNDNMIPARGKVTGIYVNSSLAKTEALESGFDEAIMLTHDGHVSEGSGENLFIVRHGKLLTPSLSEDILEGVTRATVMQIALDDLGIETIERPIDRTELYIADELFLVGTGAQISPVREIDGRIIGDGEIGPVTGALQDLYFDIVRGRSAKYREWCLSVQERAAAPHA
ncbi:MAG: branched-chain amino acid transaminase [Chloroflexota bacterium]|nr:branched-chain amino acid transaminase [Chloroflexota bacterium]